MKIFNIDQIESDLEEFKQALRDEMVNNQTYYERLTGISKQHINYFVHGKRGFSMDKLKHIYKCIQGDKNGMDKR